MAIRRARLMAWVLPAAVLAMAPAAIAQAASGTGWRVAFSHHYGTQATGVDLPRCHRPR